MALLHDWHVPLRFVREPGQIEARVLRLGETPGLRNPGEELFLAVPYRTSTVLPPD